MTVKDRLALSPVEYSPIPVMWSDEDNAWIIPDVDTSAYHYNRCDCHNLVWKGKEVYWVDTDVTSFLVCDLSFPDKAYGHTH